MSALVTHFGIRPGGGHRGFARLAVVGAILLAVLGFAADRAQAAYTAQVNNDRLTLTGNGASDQLALRLQAGDATRLQADVGDNGSADLTFDRSDFDTIVVRAGGGHDRVRIDETNGVFTDTEDTTMNGEAGNDTLLGGSAPELFRGGSENDRVDGNGGDDFGVLGSDRDSFIWDPGDGSDVVEGQGGTDTLVFNGSGASENFEFLRSGGRLLFLRDVGNIVMDTDKVEKVDLSALGGADNTIVNNLAGTDLDVAAIDLEGVLGGGAGDGQPDAITVKGTNDPDNIRIRRNGNLVNVRGLPARVQIANSEPANDELTVNGRGGNDSFSLGPGLGALIQVSVNE
jgi:Ca2+-binding RTX toxin-like protein